MKSKKIFSFLALMFVLVLSFSLTGCGKKDNNSSTIDNPSTETHEHTWGAPIYAWSDDYSTCTAVRVCTKDSTHKEEETVNTTYLETTAPTCTTTGAGKYTADFKTNDAFLDQTKEITIDALGYDYQFDSFVWEGFTAKAKYICSHDVSHVTYHDAEVSSAVTMSAGCESGGVRTYTASYDGHTDTKTEDIVATGHNWGTPTYTWSTDNTQCTARRVCANDENHVDEETVNTTFVDNSSATYTSEGKRTYTATFAKSVFETQTKEVTLDKLVYYGQVPLLSDDGKTLTYGLYPQTNVNDENLVTYLNELTTPESNGWYLYNDEYYAKVSANPNRENYTFDNGTTIVSGTTYWFKCEPITWNVLSNNDGEYYVLSSVLLDAHRYDDDSNNYENSEIRAWLNDGFYNSAFALDSSHIQITTVDNSAATTDSSSNSYACNNTQDKVFLPSYKDYINGSYGFSTSADSNDTARYCRTTDYARANGAYCYTSSGYYQYNGYYWIRSPYSDYSGGAWYVRVDGLLDFNEVDITSYSVRPGLSIRIA